MSKIRFPKWKPETTKKLVPEAEAKQNENGYILVPEIEAQNVKKRVPEMEASNAEQLVLGMEPQMSKNMGSRNGH